jgi:hypothetical protein
MNVFRRGSSVISLIQVLEPESLVDAGWIGDPLNYYADVDQTAANEMATGKPVFYCIVRPSDFVDWCRKTGAEVGSEQSSHEYLAYLYDHAGSVPCTPGLRSLHLGVVSMATHAQPILALVSRKTVRVIEATVSALTNQARRSERSGPGTYRTIILAARYDDTNPGALWDGLGFMASQPSVLAFNQEALGFSHQVTNNGGHVTGPNYVGYDPMRSVAWLALAGRGLLGVAHRGPDQHDTFRVWALGDGTITPVPAQDVVDRLKVHPEVEVLYGWA